MLTNMFYFLTFTIEVLVVTVTILSTLASITSIVPTPLAIECAAMQDSNIVFCTYNSILVANVTNMKHFIMAAPFDSTNPMASWDTLRANINNVYEWSPAMWQTVTTDGMPGVQLSYFTQVTIPYAWLAASALIAVVTGITLQPVFWQSVKRPAGCASDFIPTAARSRSPPYPHNADDGILGAVTSSQNDSNDSAIADAEYEDDSDFIDDDSASGYEEDELSDSNSDSDCASDIDSASNGSEHDEGLVPAMVMVRPSHGFRAVRMMAKELERRAGNA